MIKDYLNSISEIGEQWLPVPNTNERYYVSSNGRLVTTSFKNSNRCSIMKPALDANGYLRTMLLINGKLKTIKLHRIIAETFIPNIEDKPCVNHKDFNRANNAISNLEWCTHKENAEYSYKAGRIKKPICTNFVKGSKIGTSKLTEEQVREIRMKFKPRIYTRKMLGAEYGVSPSTIQDVILRRWKHVV